MRDTRSLCEFGGMRRGLGVLACAAVLSFAGSAGADTSLLSNVPEAINYEVIYELEIPNSANWNANPIPYTIDNAASTADGSFPRVAYYLELMTGTATQWVYVSMDTFTTDASLLGVPKTGSGAYFHHGITGPITNANILSNSGSITSGTGIDTINIEFWPSNYGGGNDYGVPGANGGTNALTWANTNYLGTVSTGLVDNAMLSNLLPGTTYHYRFYGTNSLTTNHGWSGDASFTTLSMGEWNGSADGVWGNADNWTGNNVPDSPGESARFAGAGAGNVDLNGGSYTVESIGLAGGDYVLMNSGGAATLTAGALTNSAGANTLSANVAVTGTAGVSGGTLTLDPADAFSAGGVTLSGGALVIEGDPPVAGTRMNVLTHRGYNINSDALHNLHNNGGLMATTPYGTTTLTDGPAGRGLDFNNDADFLDTGAISRTDNYMNLFVGYFVPRETGTHDFRIEQDDDVTSMWLDLDADGLFEAPGGYDTGENLRGTGNDWGTKTVTLTNGVRYLFAVTHREGGGGSGVDVNIRTPSMAAEATVKPSDPAQDGLWQVIAFGNVDASHLPITVTASSTLRSAGGQGGLTLGDVALSNGTLTATTSDPVATLALNNVHGSGGLSVRGNNLALATASSVGTLLAGNGGSVTGATITGTTLYDLEPVLTVHNSLAGDAELHAGDDDNNDGVITLLGTNTYTGLTRINRAVLRVDDGVGLPTGSRLVFYQNNRDQTCILETKGAFTRDIGMGAGEVYWENRGGGGGFAARGGDLTIELEGGAFLMWPDARRGFNSVDSLQFGSRSADGMVEVKNDIMLDGSNRRIQTIDNRDTKTDVVRFSGEIFSGNSINWLRLHESSGNQFNPGDNFYSTLMEFTGTNTYAHQTVVEECTLYAVDGVGLPTDSLLRFDGNSDQRHAVLMSSGSLNRDIGQGDGEVYWSARGGFAARGGAFVVTLEGGARLDWGSTNTGFNHQRLQLGSIHADDVVEITNDIDLDDSERHIHVWNNTDTPADVAVLSGDITGGDTNTWLRKWETGVLWLRGANSYSHRTFLDEGVIRIDSTNNLSPNTCFVFDQNIRTEPCVLEAKGSITHWNIGPITEPGAFSWDYLHGGFAAYGGPLTVNLENGVQMDAADVNTGFDGHALMLGSWTADDVVDFQNDIVLNNTAHRFQAFDNPDSATDRTVYSGDITYSGWGDVEVGGDGTLEMPGATVIRNTRVYETATLAFNGAHTGLNEIFTQGYQSGGLGGTGTVTVAYRFDIRELGRLAPGCRGAGALAVTVHGGNGFRMYDRSVYEWELGPGGGDTVAVTGNLELRDGWTVKLLGDGGMPTASGEYTLFTYTANMATYADPLIDTSAMPAEWDASGARVVHDAVNKRVYLTGLFSTMDIANAAPSDLTSTSAQLNGLFSSSGQVTDVWAYWGETDGGADAGAWSNAAKVGTFTNAIDIGVSHAVAGLETNAQYYYTFRATNAAVDLWASPSESFNALGPPVVDNGGATDIAVGAAVLRGSFGDHNRGTVVLCWGRTDAGTGSVLDWEHAENIGVQSAETFAAGISGAYYPLTYYYRCFATNAYGYDWGEPVVAFTMDIKPHVHPNAPTGAIGYWSFDDASDVGRDDSGNGNHGRQVGDAAHGSAGISKGALTLDGSGDFLNCGAGIAVDRRDFSLSFWTRRDGTGEDYVIGHTSIGGNNNQLHVGFRNATTFTFAFWGDDQNYNNAGVVGDTANYHHWVCTFDAATRQQSIYLDGATTPVSTRTANSPLLGSGDFYIGTRLGDPAVNPCFDGLIDEVYVYDRVLSGDDAAMLHAATAAVQVVSVANAQSTQRRLDSAKINGTISITNAVYDVWAYWGPADGQTNAAAWASSVRLGSYTNVVATDVSHTIGGLTPASTGFYTFRLSNAVDSVWAMPSTNFPAVAVPMVDNDGGALVDVGRATLRGTLTAGHVADVTVYWGRSDGGMDPGSWDSAVQLDDTLQGAFATGVAIGYGFPYYYRCYATNAAGSDWADDTAVVVPVPPRDYFHAGLIGGHQAGNPDMGPNGGNLGVVLGPYGGRSSAEHWNDVIGNGNSTLIYTGEIYLGGGPCTFVESIDDRARLVIDGVTLFDNGAWNDTTHGTITRPAGWYDFDLRFSHGGGGYGPTQQDGWDASFGFGMDTQGRDVQTSSHFVFPEDPGDASLFRHYDPGTAGTIVEPVLINDTVSDLTTTSATLNATLQATGWVFDVWVHWGMSDGGTNAGAWDHHAPVGAYTNHDGAIDHALLGLADQADYFYTFQATNAQTNVWAFPSTPFQTLGGAVAVSNRAPDVGQDWAALNGELVAGGSADATIYWGLADGGQSHTAWANTNHVGTVLVGGFSNVVAVLAGGTYHYRCYVSNAFGQGWAPASTTFTALQAEVSLAMAVRREDLAFDPLAIGGCELWLAGEDIDGDGDMGDNPTNGAPVDTWADKSGYGRDATREGVDRTAYNANGPNGRAVVTFEDDYLSTAHNFDNLLDYTVVTVARYTGGDNQRVISSASRNWLFGFHNNGDERWHPSVWVINQGTANTNWHIHAGHINSDPDPKASFWKDGVRLLTDNTASGANNYMIGRLGLGGYRNNNEESRCEIAEVLIYNRVLSDAELDRIGFHLSWKYGLNMPYGDSYPVAVTETRGSFEVTATLSAAAISNVTVNFDFRTNALGYVEGIRGSVFLTNVLSNTALDLDNASYALSDSRVFTGNKANTVLAMTEAPEHNVIATGEIRNFDNFPSFDGNAEHFATVFSGTVIPRMTGRHAFRGQCDDLAWMYIDMAGEGVWDNSDRVFSGNSSGSKELVRGQPYNFIFMHREGTAGQNINWYVTEPGGGEERVSTTGQAGLWNHALPAATAGKDYTVSAAGVVIPAGSLSTNITLTPVDDLDQEDDEAVAVGIASLVNATNGYPDVVSDVLSSRDPKVTHGDGATGISGWAATLNGVLAMGDAAAVTLYWGKADGGTNHASWGATISVGVVSEDMPFPRDATGLSAGEVYFFRCYATNSSNLAEDWADATACFTTTAAAVSIDDVGVVEGDTGSVNAVFTLSSSATSLVDVAVDYVTSNGTAVAGEDYTAASGTVTIAAGRVVTQLTVLVTGDTRLEHPPETFFLHLYNPTNCTIAKSEATGTIVDDDAGGYLAAWRGRMKITVAGYDGGETLENFPLLVRLSESIPKFDYDSFASDTGGDLRFANGAGTALLNHEIEEWHTGGESCVWVQVPELPPGGTTIWAHWGNAAETMPPAYTTDGSTWSDGHVAVWHLAEHNGPGSLTAPDSVNRHHGTLQNMNPSVNWVDGMIANGLNFDPANDDRRVNVSSLGENCADTTVSFWARPTGGGDRSIFHTRQWNAGDLHYFLMNNDHIRFAVNGAGFSPGNNDCDSAVVLTDNQWVYWTAVYSVAGQRLRMYRNGVLDTDRPFNGSGEIQYTHGLYIGANNAGNGREMNGRLDELRIGNVTRSASWIKACYDNQVQGSSFVVYSDVVTPAGTLLIVR